MQKYYYWAAGLAIPVGFVVKLTTGRGRKKPDDRGARYTLWFLTFVVLYIFRGDNDFFCERVCTSDRLLRRLGGLAKVSIDPLVLTSSPMMESRILLLGVVWLYVESQLLMHVQMLARELSVLTCIKCLLGMRNVSRDVRMNVSEDVQPLIRTHHGSYYQTHQSFKLVIYNRVSIYTNATSTQNGRFWHRESIVRDLLWCDVGEWWYNCVLGWLRQRLRYQNVALNSCPLPSKTLYFETPIRKTEPSKQRIGSHFFVLDTSLDNLVLRRHTSKYPLTSSPVLPVLVFPDLVDDPVLNLNPHQSTSPWTGTSKVQSLGPIRWFRMSLPIQSGSTIVVPSMGDSITEGTIAGLLKKQGKTKKSLTLTHDHDV